MKKEPLMWWFGKRSSDPPRLVQTSSQGHRIETTDVADNAARSEAEVDRVQLARDHVQQVLAAAVAAAERHIEEHHDEFRPWLMSIASSDGPVSIDDLYGFKPVSGVGLVRRFGTVEIQVSSFRETWSPSGDLERRDFAVSILICGTVLPHQREYTATDTEVLLEIRRDPEFMPPRYSLRDLELVLEHLNTLMDIPSVFASERDRWAAKRAQVAFDRAVMAQRVRDEQALAETTVVTALLDRLAT